MDAPHKAIHATADAALARAESGDFAGAMELIQTRRNCELAGLIKLFEESRQALAEGQHEIALVLARGKEQLAFTADQVESVEQIPQDKIEPLPAALTVLERGLQCRVGKRPKSGQTVLILGDDLLFSAPNMN
jgi:chemotaxis signal transduction protein